MQVPPLRRRSGGSGRDDKIEGSRRSHGGADSPQGKSQKQRQPRIFTDRHGQERGRKKMQVPPLRRRSGGSGRDDKIEGSRRSHGGADSPQGKSQKQRQPRIFTDRHGQERGRKKMQVPPLRRRSGGSGRDDKIEGSRRSHGGADSPQGKSQKQRQPRIFTDRHGQERGRKKMQVPRLAPLARDDKSKRVKRRLRSG